MNFCENTPGIRDQEESQDVLSEATRLVTFQNVIRALESAACRDQR